MGALTQYLELYRAHRDLIDANSTAALNRLRPKAAEAMESMRLPQLGDENFANFSLEAALSPDYGINLGKMEMPVNPDLSFHCDVPVSSQSVMMNVNDTFTVRPGALDQLPDGVEAGSLRDYARLYPTEVETYYGRIADMGNPIVALDTLLAQDGLYLRVRAGVNVEKPLQLVNILAGAMPVMAVRRVLIVMERGSSAKLLVCDHSQSDATDLLSLCVTEAFVGEGASLDIYDIEESTITTARLAALYVKQERDSQVNAVGMTLFNGKTRNETYTRFNGENASLRLYGMGIEDKNRVVSTYTHIDHAVPHCHSDELYKFSIDDTASGDFTGRIHVAPFAVGTEAYQANRNLVGEGGAKMTSKPQLEIYNDDVKCSHGCAIGQLDPMEVFYMRTRGLTETTAKQLLRQAFMADVIGAVRIDSLRDRLHMLVERRFAGLESACSKCNKNGCTQA